MAFGLTVDVRGGQRRCEILQCLPLSLYSEDGFDHPAGDHQGRTDEVTHGDLGDVPGR